MLDLTLLKNFVTVARAGSISTAATQVGRTQSALSTQMQRLEEQVGQPLLQRTGAGVRVTAAGENCWPMPAPCLPVMTKSSPT